MNLNRPPRLASWVLVHCIEPSLRDAALGEFEFLFEEMVSLQGRRAAVRHFWIETRAAIWMWLKMALQRRPFMVGNYLKTGMRTLRRSLLNTGINVLGFALAIAWAVLVFCFVRDEYRFDRFHTYIDRLVLAVAQYDNGQVRSALGTQAPLGQMLKEEYPEFDASARLLKNNVDVKLDHEAFQVDMLGTDVDFFEMFSFPLAYGTPETFSSIADCIYLSWPMAKRLYGDDDALGRRLYVQVNGELEPFEVAERFQAASGEFQHSL